MRLPFRRNRPQGRRKLQSRSLRSSTHRAQSRVIRARNLPIKSPPCRAPRAILISTALFAGAVSWAHRLPGSGPIKNRPSTFASSNFVEVFEERVVTGKLGKPTVAEVVLCGCALSVVSLKRAHHVFGVMRPQPGLLGVFVEIPAEASRRLSAASTDSPGRMS